VTKRPVFLIFIFVILLLAVGMLLYLNFWTTPSARRPSGPGAAGESPFATYVEQPAEGAKETTVALFFAADEIVSLQQETREVMESGSVENRIAQVLGELIKGPKTNLVPVIPAGVKLRGVYLANEGVAYVDFTEELRTNLLGGSCDEIFAVYGVVNTVTFNFPRIKGVKILVNGQERETLNGHIALDRPLKQDMKWVAQETAGAQFQKGTE
jgi:spore germination protein GerM